ncbi:flagellar hook capping FlgD N-terminal domain-containing protein [Treponema sp.]|uniref:flagellar hook capping FlgD N-terminal domain-containing protein n=1 Tax=Treponema sp. TaxID=166 RepID=UPI00298DD977|nr:flagellar hook capping FlgD N-terminal domain-containing protein [Treponema sp.]MCR5612445.1 flagellar hook assembly protein FlgD [Treponema sp.]
MVTGDVAYNPKMSPQEMFETQMAVDRHNKENTFEGRQIKQQLDKNDFLTLLLAQLSHQDPTQPMENTEFVAQMAQFSSLEQIHNMSEGFNKMASLMHNNEAVSTLGKVVDIEVGDAKITGTVDSITRGEVPQVSVNGKFYNMEYISAVYGN